jgi:hypothetical protein
MVGETTSTAYNDAMNSSIPSSCPNKKIMNARTLVGYDTLDQAISDASSDDIVKIQNNVVLPNENIILGKNITLDGGYDCFYTNKIGLMTSIIQGTVSIQNSAAALSNILIDSVGASYLSEPVALSDSQQSGNVETLSGTMQTGYKITITADTNVTIGPISYPTSSTWTCTISGLAVGSNTLTITSTSPTAAKTTITTSAYYSGASPVPAMSPFSLMVAGSALFSMLFFDRKIRQRP